MKLEKLKIIPFKDEKFTSKVNDGLELMINPSSYKMNSSIGYTNNQAQGRSSRSPKFTSAGPDTMEFETTYDGTGAIPTGSSAPVSVKSQIDLLRMTVYTYDGSIHQPNYLKIVWGGILFKCRLTSFSIDYKLFAPSGQPLRAKVSLKFQGYVSPEEESLNNNQQSPDLTHLIVVKAGDTLPLLCYKIYNDSSYYAKVARINGLTNFRSIQPGMHLEFPPIRK
jgi:hypothetical protein